jgi:hypothetical protein
MGRRPPSALLGRCRPMWGICSPRSAPSSPRLPIGLSVRQNAMQLQGEAREKSRSEPDTCRPLEVSICRFQLRLSASTEHADERLRLAVTSTLLGVPGEGRSTGPPHWRRCAVEKSHALFIHSLWTRATSMLTDFSWGGFAVAWTGTSPLPLPLPLVPVAFARMLTADGPPREGLQPWQRSSSPRRPGQLYVADRYAMRPFGAASASGLVWAEPPTQWSRERGKGSVHVGSAAALPNLEMTMSCSWDIT